jgi:putative autotransporter adhesin-like protein
MKRYLMLILILLFFIPSLACRSSATGPVKGSGNIITQTVDVSGFDQVTLEGFGDVYLEQGQTESLSVQTDDNLFSLLDIRVRGKELRIGIKPGFDVSPSESITYNLTVKDLHSVSLAGSGNFYIEPVKSSDLTVSVPGSGNIKIKGMNTDKLSIDLNGSGNITIEDILAKTVDASLRGSGDIKLTGNTNTQFVTINGSGNYLTGSLETDKTQISLPGSADVTLWANDELKIQISGSGNLQYYGQPSVDQNISGSGNITPLGEK